MLDGELAARVFDNARKLGVRNFAVHKGVSLYGMQPEMSSPRDMGAAAKANPDLTFLVYHSAFQPGVKEGPYDPGRTRRRPADQGASGCRPAAQRRQPLRRARLDLALFHEPARRGGARAGQAARDLR